MSVLIIFDESGDTPYAWPAEVRAPEVPDALINEIELAFDHAARDNAAVEFAKALDRKCLIVRSDDEAGLINLEVVRKFDPNHQGSYVVSNQPVGG